MSDTLNELAAFAGELADLSRAILLAAGDDAARYESKDDSSPVTPFDRHVEATLRERIAERYPGHGILGEEHGSEALNAEVVWVIDPIDGTKPFITGLPLYSTLIGLAVDGRFRYGVMDYPATAERCTGGPGFGAFLNGHPIRTRACAELGQAIAAAGVPTRDGPGERAAAERLIRACRWAVWGAGSYAFGRVASGRIDLSVYRSCDVYDYAAAVPIIEAAGGHCCEWSGAPLELRSGGNVLLLGDEALAEPACRRLAG